MNGMHVDSICVFIINYAITRVLGGGDYVPLKVEVPQYGNVKILTEHDLQKYNGYDRTKPIYVAVKGAVFDVTSDERIFGVNGPYSIYAGRDVTRAVAKMSIEGEDLRHETAGLTNSEMQSLDIAYKSQYLDKYRIVGYMDYLMNNGGINMNQPGRSFVIGDTGENDEF